MTKTALLVIDAQKIYSLPDSELSVEGATKILNNINKIIRVFQSTKRDIIYVRHIHKPDGSDSGRMWDFTGADEDIGFVQGSDEVEYMDGLLRVEGSTEIIKRRYSAFEGTKLLKKLQEQQIRRIAIVGFMTNFCCESTAREAHDKDYYVDFIEDATGCPDLEYLPQAKIKEATCATLSVGYAVIYKTAKYLKMLAKQ